MAEAFLAALERRRQAGGRGVKFTLSVGMLEASSYLPLARAAEAHGWHAIAVPESVFYPELVSVKYPYTKDGARFWQPDTPYLDPWVAIPAMAAVTERLFFYTNVIKLGIRSPLLVAKTVGSAAVLSNERVGLGVGLGWIPEEFAWCGTDYATRGARVDEALEILTRLLGGGADFVEFHGKHFDFGRLTMSPAPRRPVPLYVGGHSEPALRRAAKYGDGWCSAMMKTREFAPVVARLGELRREYGRADRPFAIQAACIDAFDVDGYRRLADAGVTELVTQPWVLYGAGMKATLEQQLDGVKRFAEDVFGLI